MDFKNIDSIQAIAPLPYYRSYQEEINTNFSFVFAINLIFHILPHHTGAKQDERLGPP